MRATSTSCQTNRRMDKMYETHIVKTTQSSSDPWEMRKRCWEAYDCPGLLPGELSGGGRVPVGAQQTVWLRRSASPGGQRQESSEHRVPMRRQHWETSADLQRVQGRILLSPGDPIPVGGLLGWGEDPLGRVRLRSVSQTHTAPRMVPVPTGRTGKTRNSWDIEQSTQKSLV